MNEPFSDETLRRRLRALDAPPATAGLLRRVRAGAPASRRHRPLTWATGLALSALLVALAVAALEYRDWRETEELARLDELSVASMLVL